MNPPGGRDALIARVPALAAIPWRSLGRFPTPIVALPTLGARIGVDLWCKRDDVSAVAYGGNKVRKLEPLLAEAHARGRRSVVTAGGVGSHHIVATALFARRAYDWPTVAVVFPQPDTPTVREHVALGHALGVHRVTVANRLLLPLGYRTARRIVDDPAMIPPGGSSPVGALGFVAAAFELAAQIDAGVSPCPDRIVVAVGSGGTVAGLAVGVALARLPIEVVGVAVVERWLMSRAWVAALIARIRALLASHGVWGLPRVPTPRIVNGFVGAGYGAPTVEATQAVSVARDDESLALETTYTGKALAALVAGAAARRGDRVLFWNTFNSRDVGGINRRSASP